VGSPKETGEPSLTLVDCYEWIDESESERSRIMLTATSRRTGGESPLPESKGSQ